MGCFLDPDCHIALALFYRSEFVALCGFVARIDPLDIYQRWFRNFLIFVVPLGCVAYFPVERLLGRPDRLGAPDWMLDLSLLFGFVFLIVALGVWRFGVRLYTSTGS